MLVFAATLTATPVGASPGPHDVVGNWRGFSLAERGDPSRGDRAASLEVLAQDGRRFHGVAVVGGSTCRVSGTVGESLRMNGSGECSSASSGPLAEREHLVLDLHSRMGTSCAPCALSGRWRLTGEGGDRQDALVLLQDGEGPEHLVRGAWHGSAQDEDGNHTGRISAEFGPAEGGGVNQMVLNDTPGRDFAFDVLLDLTVPVEPGAPFGFTVVGGGDDGLMLFRGRFTPETADVPASWGGSLLLLGGHDGGSVAVPVLWPVYEIEAVRRP